MVAPPAIVQSLAVASTSTSPVVVVISPSTVCSMASVATSPTSPPVLVIRAFWVMSSAELNSTSPFSVVTVASRLMPFRSVAS